MNEERVNSVVSDIESISEDARSSFGGLTTAQLNWKPSEKEWSVAQCLEHLITVDSLYCPVFEKIRTGDFANTFWEKYSPFSELFGRMLIKSMRPENLKKTKTSRKAYPSESEIDAGIVGRFQDHNRELAGHIANVPAEFDLKTIMTSPLLGIVTYSLDDCLTMLVVHERRHVLQAKRVMESFESRI